MGKLRKTRKRGPNSKKLRGGVAPNSIHYKYTNDIKRGQWVDTIYPYGGVIISILPKIRWKSFHYEGQLLIEIEDDTLAGGGGFKYKNPDNTEIKKLYDTMGHTLPLSEPPYEVFGGAACELWGRKIPDIPIHAFVDSTGDIDVMVSTPIIVPENAFLQEFAAERGIYTLHPLMVYEGKYTLYGDSFSRWLFHEVVEHFSLVAGQFNISELDLPLPEEHSETVLGDLHATVGNLLFSRFITYDSDSPTIKIQITTKVLPNTVGDIIEFLISYDGAVRHYQSKFTVDGIYVDEPYRILVNQVRALEGRSVFKNKRYSYKFDNHCARVLYLATLTRFLENKYYPENDRNFTSMTAWMAVPMLDKLYKNDIASMCDEHFGPNYIDKLINIFESMKHIGPGGIKRYMDARKYLAPII
jgi:hypothetical protein